MGSYPFSAWISRIKAFSPLVSLMREVRSTEVGDMFERQVRGHGDIPAAATVLNPACMTE